MVNTRLIKPKQNIGGGDHRSVVILINQSKDDKGFLCYHFKYPNGTKEDGNNKMSLREIYLMHPEYANYNFENFVITLIRTARKDFHTKELGFCTNTEHMEEVCSYTCARIGPSFLKLKRF
eukprot:jgi/Psemu1/26189/gm1.26189_g